jgi:sRNA-binding protein
LNADKQRKYTEALAAIVLLEARWPRAFSLNQLQRRPLKVGIRLDIVAAGVELTPGALSSALRTYCSNRFYLKRLQAGAARIGLDGETAGFVNPDDAKRASDALIRRATRHREQSAARAAVVPCSSTAGGGTVMVKPRRLSLSDLRAAAAARRQKETA